MKTTTTITRAGLLLAALGLAAPATAQPWRYVDKSGAVTYTSNPYDLPRAKQAKALEQLSAQREAQRKAREERAAAKAQAQATSALAPEGVPAPVAQPVRLDADETQTDPKAIWQANVVKARRAVLDAKSAADAADRQAAAANRRAIITPSGFNYAAHEEAQKAKAEKGKALIQAEAALQRLQRQQPR